MDLQITGSRLLALPARRHIPVRPAFPQPETVLADAGYCNERDLTDLQPPPEPATPCYSP